MEKGIQAYIVLNGLLDIGKYYLPPTFILVNIGGRYSIYDGKEISGIMGRPINIEDEIKILNGYLLLKKDFINQMSK